MRTLCLAVALVASWSSAASAADTSASMLPLPWDLEATRRTEPILLAAKGPEVAQGDAKPAAATADPKATAAIDEANRAAKVALETVVTATRSPRARSEVTSQVTVLTRDQIERSPELRVDDILRTVPAFQTFRRTSSVAADPTAQGVNLRNVGPSGVSRALVLYDGVPLNDPFGGWVYWRAVPRLSLERVEIVPGASSALYGSAALGGAVQLFSRPIMGTSVDIDVLAGNRYSYDVAARTASQWGGFGASLEAEHFQTSGYLIVPGGGPVDRAGPSAHDNVRGRAEYAVTKDLAVDLRGSYFDESQNGGTFYTNARVRVGLGSAGVSWHLPSGGDLQARFWAQSQLFTQNRARITSVVEPRDTEVGSARQENSSDSEGLSLTWVPSPIELGGRHLPTLGVDALRVAGLCAEELYLGPITTRDSRGSQYLLGAFAQDAYQPIPSVEILAGVRVDGWINRDGRRDITYNDGRPDDQFGFTPRSDMQVSPRLGFRWQMLSALILRGSGYLAFRAPTLNELYRPFQVGQILTDSNADLSAERLRGTELGLELALPAGVSAKLTGFYNFLENPIVNVSITPTARVRRNLGSAQILGAEASVDVRLANYVLAQAAYIYAPTQVLGAEPPTLVSKQLIQAPIRRATIALSYDNPELLTASGVVRYIGSQYEDDANTLFMPAAWVIDLAVRRELVGGIDAYVTVNNLLNAQYLVGRPGVDNVGEPITVLAGVRFRYPR